MEKPDKTRLSKFPKPPRWEWEASHFAGLRDLLRVQMDECPDGHLIEISSVIDYDGLGYAVYHMACELKFKGHVSIKRSRKLGIKNLRIYAFTPESARLAQAYDEEGYALEKTITMDVFNEETEEMETKSFKIPILKPNWFYINKEDKSSERKVRKDVVGSGVVVVAKAREPWFKHERERKIVDCDGETRGGENLTTLFDLMGANIGTFRAKPPKRERAPRPPKGLKGLC